MVERADEPRLTTPIVPGPDDELTNHRSAGNKHAPRVWPLWLLIIVLLAGMVALAGFYWLDRQAWQTSQRELAGQVSNMHARLDSLDDSHGSSSQQLAKKLPALDEAQQSLSQRVDALNDTLNGLEEDTVKRAAIAKLEQRLTTTEEQSDTLAATLNATRRSLTALEKQGNEARQGLSDRLERLDSERQRVAQRRESQTQDLQALASRTDDLVQTQQGLQRQLEALSELEAQMASLDDRVDSLDEASRSQQDGREKIQARIREIRTAVTELRQNQVAINASLESLGSTN